MPYKRKSELESIPAKSDINNYHKGAYYADSFSVVTRYENQSSLDLFLTIASGMPHWVNTLMRLRNSIMSRLGIKDLGGFADIDFSKPSENYEVGDRVGIFAVHCNSHCEVILEVRDRY